MTKTLPRGSIAVTSSRTRRAAPRAACTETADAAAGGDVELLHDLRCPDLPHAGQRLENGRHLHLADGVVVGLGQEIGVILFDFNAP